MDWVVEGPTDCVVGNDLVWGSDLEVVMSTLGVGTGVGVTNFGMMGAIDNAHTGCTSPLFQGGAVPPCC